MKVKVEITNADTWIELVIDGAKEVARVVKPGEIIELTAKESVELVTGKFNSTKFSINDIAQSFAGQSGVGQFVCTLDKDEENGFVCEVPE